VRVYDRLSAAAVDCGLGPASARTPFLIFLHAWHQYPAEQERKMKMTTGSGPTLDWQSMSLGIFI